MRQYVPCPSPAFINLASEDAECDDTAVTQPFRRVTRAAPPEAPETLNLDIDVRDFEPRNLEATVVINHARRSPRRLAWFGIGAAVVLCVWAPFGLSGWIGAIKTAAHGRANPPAIACVPQQGANTSGCTR